MKTWIAFVALVMATTTTYGAKMGRTCTYATDGLE